MSEMFKEYFKVSKKQINSIKKEYKESKEAAASLSSNDLKNYSAHAAVIFDFYENLTSRSINRELMNPHVFYYFDEGFHLEEMKLYIKNSKADLWYQEHPDAFTIQRLFPIKDQDRINTVWDLLAFYLSKLNRGETIEGKKISELRIIRKECSHIQNMIDYRNGTGCSECKDSELACSFEPYTMMPIVETNELRELCWFFMRHNEESLSDYARRTFEKRREIMLSNNLKCGSENSVVDMLKTGGAIK